MTSLRADVAKLLDECWGRWATNRPVLRLTHDSFGAYATDALFRLLAERGVKVLGHEATELMCEKGCDALGQCIDMQSVPDDDHVNAVFYSYRAMHDAAKCSLTTENGDG